MGFGGGGVLPSRPRKSAGCYFRVYPLVRVCGRKQSALLVPIRGGQALLRGKGGPVAPLVTGAASAPFCVVAGVQAEFRFRGMRWMGNAPLKGGCRTGAAARHAKEGATPPPPPPPCDIPSGCCSFTGALDSHPFFPSHVASGRCVLSAAAAGAPAGVVSAFAEPSGWCAGAVLNVAGCAVCVSTASSSWCTGGCAGCCGGRLTVFAVHTPPSAGRPQPASLCFRVREPQVPCPAQAPAVAHCARDPLGDPPAPSSASLWLGTPPPNNNNNLHFQSLP